MDNIKLTSSKWKVSSKTTCKSTIWQALGDYQTALLHATQRVGKRVPYFR